jgi:hypothetical protein
MVSAALQNACSFKLSQIEQFNTGFASLLERDASVT